MNKVYQGMTENDDFIITSRDRNTGRVIINRPKVLNALSKDMCAEINSALIAWASDDAIDRVLITAVEGRAFCAGGDVRSIIPLIKQDPNHSDAYFNVEYQLDSIITSYPKPVVVVADGLTMGAGAGVLLNASHPIITEAMDFAMPETAIGLFPDVAASLFLRRAKGLSGVFMGMTGWRINCADMLALGIADRAVPSADVAALTEDILSLDGNHGLDDLLARYAKPIDDNTPVLDALDWINHHFSKATPAEIRASLDGDDHAFAEPARHALDTRSPLSIVLTHELLTNDAHKPDNILDAMALDFVLACRISRYADFVEGVRAVLIDKDNAPKWLHADLASVEAEIIADVFSPDDRPLLTLPPEYRPLMKPTNVKS